MQRSSFRSAAVAIATCVSGIMSNTPVNAAGVASAPTPVVRPPEVALISYDFVNPSKVDISGCSSLMAMRAPFSTLARSETASCKSSAKWRLAGQVTSALLNPSIADTQVVSMGLRPDLQNLVGPCREKIKSMTDKSAAVKSMNSCLEGK